MAKRSERTFYNASQVRIQATPFFPLKNRYGRTVAAGPAYGPYATAKGSFTKCSLTTISTLTHNFCVIRFTYRAGVAKNRDQCKSQLLDLQFAFQARKSFFTIQSKPAYSNGFITSVVTK